MLSRPGWSTNTQIKVLSPKIRKAFRAVFYMGVLAGMFTVTNHTDPGFRTLVVILCDCYPLVSDGIWSVIRGTLCGLKKTLQLYVITLLLRHEAQHTILLLQALFPYFLILLRLSFKLQWCLLNVVKCAAKWPLLTAGFRMQGSLHCACEKTRDRSSHYWIVV